jgi:DNA repair protein RadD
MKQVLRDYQQESVDGLKRSLMAGKRRPILVAPCGSGKTTVACAIIQGALEKEKRVLFLAPRRELIYQAEERMHDHGIEAGIIMSGEVRDPQCDVQVASFDTLHARGIRNESMSMPPADILIVDECHLSIAKTRQDIINHYDNAVVIGLTATPARGDGRGMGEIYDDLVLTRTIGDLTDEGHLVPARYFAPTTPDLNKIKQTKSDYRVKELGEVMDKPKMVGDIIENWQKICPDRQTVVFCVTKEHARHVHEAFLAIGVAAGYLDSDTKLDERRQILRDIHSGKIQVLINIFVATFGWDCPPVSCVILARPTKNITLYLQTVGRGLRTHPGKDDCIVIDHTGAVEQHGFVDEDIPWTLDSEVDIRDAREKALQEKSEPKEITCQSCRYIFKARRDCPRCGFEAVPKGKPIPVHQATLKEISRPKVTTFDKQNFWIGCLYRASHNNLKAGAAAHMYRKQFGVWPKGLERMPRGGEWQMKASRFLENSNGQI